MFSNKKNKFVASFFYRVSAAVLALRHQAAYHVCRKCVRASSVVFLGNMVLHLLWRAHGQRLSAKLERACLRGLCRVGHYCSAGHAHMFVALLKFGFLSA